MSERKHDIINKLKAKKLCPIILLSRYWNEYHQTEETFIKKKNIQKSQKKNDTIIRIHGTQKKTLKNTITNLREQQKLQAQTIRRNTNTIMIHELYEQLFLVQKLKRLDAHAFALGQLIQIIVGHGGDLTGVHVEPVADKTIKLRVNRSANVRAEQLTLAQLHIREHDLAEFIIQVHLFVVDKRTFGESLRKESKQIRRVLRRHVDQHTLG